MTLRPTLSGLCLALFGILFLLSCATTRRYESMLEGWIGQGTPALEKKWGKPSKISTYGDGRKLCEYRFTDRHEVIGDNVRGIAASHTGCTTFFVLSPGGIVEAWKWEGDDCMAK